MKIFQKSHLSRSNDVSQQSERIRTKYPYYQYLASCANDCVHFSQNGDIEVLFEVKAL